MIVDLRTYTLAAGRMDAFIAAYSEQGFPLYKKYCGRLVGYFTGETGELNQVVHLWAYEDYEDRTRRRAKLLQDPAWQSFMAIVAPWLVHQQSRILRPAAFADSSLNPWWQSV